jgi:hypothetical protein
MRQRGRRTLNSGGLPKLRFASIQYIAFTKATGITCFIINYLQLDTSGARWVLVNIDTKVLDRFPGSAYSDSRSLRYEPPFFTPDDGFGHCCGGPSRRPIEECMRGGSADRGAAQESEVARHVGQRWRATARTSASPTTQPTILAVTPSKIRCAFTICTPRFCLCWGSITTSFLILAAADSSV